MSNSFRVTYMGEEMAEKSNSNNLNIKQIQSVLTELTREKQSQGDVKKLCDIYGGFGSIDAVVHRDVFVIYGGEIENII